MDNNHSVFKERLLIGLLIGLVLCGLNVYFIGVPGALIFRELLGWPMGLILGSDCGEECWTWMIIGGCLLFLIVTPWIFLLVAKILNLKRSFFSRLRILEIVLVVLIPVLLYFICGGTL